MPRGTIEPTLREVEFQKLVIECGMSDCPYGRASYNSRAHRHFSYEDYDFSIMHNEEIVEHYDGILYKWIDSNGMSAYGGTPLKWDLPKNGQPGAWAEPDSKHLSTCKHGLHALREGDRGFGGHGRLFIAEADGPVMITSGKVVCMRLRLVQEIDTRWDIKAESEAAIWKTQRESLRKNHPVLRPYLRPTRDATKKALARALKPKVEVYRRLMLDKAKHDARAEFVYFDGPLPSDHWNVRRRIMADIRKARKDAQAFHQYLYYVDLKPGFTELVKANAIEADPNYIAYMNAEEE